MRCELYIHHSLSLDYHYAIKFLTMYVFVHLLNPICICIEHGAYLGFISIIRGIKVSCDHWIWKLIIKPKYAPYIEHGRYLPNNTYVVHPIGYCFTIRMEPTDRKLCNKFKQKQSCNIPPHMKKMVRLSSILPHIHAQAWETN